jgi:hypothetical protein
MSSLKIILSSNSFLEYAFLKYVLSPAVRPLLVPLVHPQYKIDVDAQLYFLDYLLGPKVAKMLLANSKLGWS